MKYRDKVLPVYLEETREHIESLSNLLVELERDPNKTGCIDEIFRRVHTLKGGAASFGFTTIGEVAHRFENILDDVRSSRLVLNKQIITVLFEAADVLKQLLDAAVNGVEPGDIQVLAEKLKDIANAEGPTVNQLRCNVTMVDSCKMKAPRFVVILKTLQRMGDVLSTDPAEPLLLMGEFDTKFHVDLITPQSPEEIIQAVSKLQDVKAVEITQIESSPSSISLDPVPSPISEPAPALEKVKGENGSRPIYVRVDVMKLENMINLIGELVIERNRLGALIAKLDSKEDGSQVLNQISNQLGRITSELQMEIMSSRMVPISQVFGNLPRLARDTANALGKEITLTIIGEETELDRTLVEKLRDPMVHLLRNAIDHGIETPEVRIKAGKPAAGNITIQAQHQDNNIMIKVSDDGKGINFYAVIKKIIEKGLRTPEELQDADEEELTSLVFLPGFSTAASVSDISGRGVGLDVVKNGIEQLNGSVSVDSKQGIGTEFSIRLPLTLAIIKALLFEVSGREFALPLANILETLSASQYRSEFAHGSAVIRLRDKIIPLVDMSELLGLPPTDGGKRFILVITNGEGLLGLLVDSLIEKQEIVIKSLGNLFLENRELAGVTLLGNGTIVPILDASGIFRLTGYKYVNKNYNS